MLGIIHQNLLNKNPFQFLSQRFRILILMNQFGEKVNPCIVVFLHHPFCLNRPDFVLQLLDLCIDLVSLCHVLVSCEITFTVFLIKASFLFLKVCNASFIEGSIQIGFFLFLLNFSQLLPMKELLEMPL